MATSTVVTKKTNGHPKAPEVHEVIHAEPVSITSPTGFASILVSCCGQLEYTKICLPSIVRHTRKPYELIFLDIGSLDGTAEYLAGFGVSAQVPIKIVRTPPAAWHRGCAGSEPSATS